MKILAIDTAMEACSAAIMTDNFTASRFEIGVRRHNELILPMIEAVLADAGVTLKQLDGLAFGRGPGAFTGLRIAAGVVQGLALSHQLRVWPVSDLAAIALRVAEETGTSHVLVLSDARMGQVYRGEFAISEGMPESIGEESVADPSDIGAPAVDDWVAAGTGWRAGGQQLRPVSARASRVVDDSLPRAVEIARLAIAMGSARSVSAELALPVYLRDRVAKPLGNRGR